MLTKIERERGKKWLMLILIPNGGHVNTYSKCLYQVGEKLLLTRVSELRKCDAFLGAVTLICLVGCKCPALSPINTPQEQYEVLSL